MTNEQGVKMYGPAKWAAMTATRNANALGWSWGDIGEGLLNIGKAGLGIFTTAQQTDVYKSLYEQQAAQRQDTIVNLIKWGTILGIGIFAAKAIKG
jgi:hypothetical protein